MLPWMGAVVKMKVWLCVALSVGPIYSELARDDDVYFAATGNPTDDGLAQFQAATSDLCIVLEDDVEGMQRHEHPLAAGMSMGHESRRLSFRTLALVRHGVALWKTRAWGRTWCLRLGMTASSWDGWAKMHMNPSLQCGSTSFQ